MVASIGHTTRDHLTGRYVLLLVVLLALIYGLTQDIEMVAAIALGLVFVETISILRDTSTVDSRWAGVGLGAFITVVSLAWFAWELTAAAEMGGPAWFPALTALIGVWSLFDARTDFADGADSYASDDMDASEMMLVLNHGHLVVEELKQDEALNELAVQTDQIGGEGVSVRRRFRGQNTRGSGSC